MFNYDRYSTFGQIVEHFQYRWNIWLGVFIGLFLLWLSFYIGTFNPHVTQDPIAIIEAKPGLFQAQADAPIVVYTDDKEPVKVIGYQLHDKEWHVFIQNTGVVPRINAVICWKNYDSYGTIIGKYCFDSSEDEMDPGDIAEGFVTVTNGTRPLSKILLYVNSHEMHK